MATNLIPAVNKRPNYELGVETDSQIYQKMTSQWSTEIDTVVYANIKAFRVQKILKRTRVL